MYESNLLKENDEMKLFLRNLCVCLTVLVCAVSTCLLFSGCEVDTTPPGPVSNLVALAGDGTVSLGWSNPSDSDFAGVTILRKNVSAPTSPEDGTAVYTGVENSFVDETVSNGTEYFYSAFAFDTSGNYSEGVSAQATPTIAGAEERILQEYEDIRVMILDDPEEALEEADKEDLEEHLQEAEALYRGGDLCGAGEVLYSKYLRKTQELRHDKAVNTAEDLYNKGRTLRQDILASIEAKEECPGSERVGLTAEANVEEESAASLSISGIFGEPRFISIAQGEGASRKIFTDLQILGAETANGEPGAPAVPIYRNLIAAPIGAKVTLDDQRQSAAQVVEEISMLLYPCQPQPLDDDMPDPSVFANAPFTQNLAIYDSDEPYPPEAVSIKYMGNGRDVEYYLVEVASGQYYPKSNKLRLFGEADIHISFEGGDGVFLTENMLSPFESNASLYTGAVLNTESLSKFVGGKIINTFGEEFIIFTHPNFQAAAERLRDWKRSKGIWTSVILCGTGSDTNFRSNNSIVAEIHRRYNENYLRPSYVLLFGDAEFIAPFYINGIGTDWPYAVLGNPQTDRIPDFAVGRISVDTAEQANTVVSKIIQYEKEPPRLESFYEKAAIAAQFQCCRTGASESGVEERTFVEVSEFARNVMSSAGKTVDRLYIATGNQIPARYYDGTPLPSALRYVNGFSWNANYTDIQNTWNEGRFLIMHRDHGGVNGWSDPRFTVGNIPNLRNGALLPVVFSVNCASGFWDNETADSITRTNYGTSASGVYFAEQLLRKADGGAVGLLCDTRNSPSWENSVLTQGFFDAIWSSAVGTFGSNVSQRRLGDILNHGKLYLMSKSGMGAFGSIIGESASVAQLYLWHCLGDPTLELWTSNPYQQSLIPNLKYRFLRLVSPWEGGPPVAESISLEYPVEGAIITVYRPDNLTQTRKPDPRPIGRGVVNNGVSFIDLLDPIPLEEPLEFVASAPNAISTILKGNKIN